MASFESTLNPLRSALNPLAQGIYDWLARAQRGYAARRACERPTERRAERSTPRLATRIGWRRSGMQTQRDLAAMATLVAATLVSRLALLGNHAGEADTGLFIASAAGFYASLIFLFSPSLWWLGIEPHPQGPAIACYPAPRAPARP